LKEHLIVFNEPHILDDDDVGAVGVKEKNLFIRGNIAVLALKVLFLELKRCC
jgi:hypothetical protein